MNKQLIAALAIGLLAAVVTSDAGENKKDDLEGTWHAVAIEVEGKRVPEKEVKGLSMTIKDGTLTARTPDGRETNVYRYRIDASKSPKWIDFEVIRGADVGKKQLGIFRLKRDHLEMVGNEKGAPRPTEFKTKPGSGWVLVVLKRQKD